jgi:hypothetical protein
MESFQSNKTIYLVWRNYIQGVKTNGFGDKLRSAIATYQYCKEKNIRFIIDGTDDICSEFLKNIKSNEYDMIKDQKLVIIDCPNYSMPCNFEDRINDVLEKNDNVFIYTNKCPKDDCASQEPNLLSEEEKEFAKYICEPMEFLKKEIDEKIKKLPENYGIQHFRFNDVVFSKDIDENDPYFIQYFDILQKNYKPTDVLLSNSNNFKKYAKNKLNITTVDCDDLLCKVEHIGNSSNYESVKNSFIEFFIVTKSKYIKSISCYDWVSNFIKWPAIIYNIPLEVYMDAFGKCM